MEGQTHNRQGRRIKLLTPLGKGGFGAVYLADVTTRDGLVQRLAVKLLHESWANDNGIAARARDEARLMSQLNHDNVLKIYGLTRLSDRAAVLMEYVEGIDCRTMVVETARAAGEVRGLPPRVAASIIERAAGALAAAWADVSPQTGQPLRVVHRDIKPSNLLVSINGAVKVMDFGVARADFEREALTGSVQFGTHRYMAPERWLKGEAGHTSDLFSLGVTFWELLTGVRFERLPLDPVVYAEARDAQIARLETLGMSREVTAALSTLIRDMLTHDERERVDAIMVEERLGALEGELGGEGLRRFARRELPSLVQIQLHSLKSDPDLLDMTGTLLVEDTPVSQPSGAEPSGAAPSGAAPMLSTATAPVPSLVADLPTPTAPTGSPSSAPTRPIAAPVTGPVERLSAPIERPSEPIEHPLALEISSPYGVGAELISASVTVPQQRGGTSWYVAALGAAVLVGGAMMAWSGGWFDGDELVPGVAAIDGASPASAEGASPEVASAEGASPEDASDEAAPTEAAAGVALAAASPGVTPASEPAILSVSTSSLAPTQEPAGAAPIDEGAPVGEGSVDEEFIDEEFVDEDVGDGIVEVSIGDAEGEEAAPDVRVIRLVEAEPPPLVTFKLIASPREGSFSLNGVAYGVGAVTLPEGTYQLNYVGPDWQRSCAVQVHVGLSRVKVSKEVPGCQAS